MANALNLQFGSPVNDPSTVTTFVTFALNESLDVWATVFSLPTNIAITTVGFRYGVRTGTPPTYKISLQSVDASNGRPSGTVLGGGSPASKTFTPPADATWNSTWQWLTLDNAYTTTGAIIALVIAYDSGTINSSNTGSFTTALNSGSVANLSYGFTNNVSGSPQKSQTAGVYGLRDASRTYGNPIVTLSNTQFSSDSTPDEYALRFMIPTTFCETFKISGFSAQLGGLVTGKTMVINLYDTDGTSVLQTFTWDADMVALAGFNCALVTIYFPEASLATLNAGSVYRLGFAPQETGALATLLTYDYDSAASLSSCPFGAEWYLNTRTNGGAWTNDSTVNYRRPGINLIFADWSVAAASSGGGSWGSA